MGKRLKALWWALKLVCSKRWAVVYDVVCDVAQTPDMNNGKAWGKIGNIAGQVPGLGENVHRHLLALQKIQSQIGRQDVDDLLIHLAYIAYKKRRS